MNTRQIAQRFTGPLLMEPLQAEAFMASLAQADEPGAFERWQQTRPDPAVPQVINGVALVSVAGALASGVSDRARYRGVTGYEDIVAQVRAAMEMPEVHSIVLEVNSPGGEAAGAYECCDALARLQGPKPIIGLGTGIAASAGYMLLSQADRVLMTRAASIGSVGVILTVVGLSKAFEAAGIEVKVLHRGARKADGHPFKALDEATEANLLSRIETFYSMFVTHVAERRGLDEAAVRGQESRLFVGPQVLNTGLVDGVTTLPELLLELSNQGVSMTGKPGAAGPQSATPAPAAPEAARVDDTLEAVARSFPQASQAIREQALASERQRVAAIDAAVQLSPKLTELGERAKAEGMSLEAFGLEALKVKDNPGAAHLRALTTENDADLPAAAGADVDRQPGKTKLSESQLEGMDPKQRAKAEWDADPQLRSHFDLGDGAEAAYARYELIRCEELRRGEAA